MNMGNRGQIRIIEAFLAALILFSSLAISANVSVTQNSSSREDMSPAGLQVLMKLDSDGSLGRYIDSKDWSTLREVFDLALQTGVTFNITVYDVEMHPINDEIISNGGFSSEDVAFVEYICVGHEDAFHCYIVHLYLVVAS
ncbi:hypothetical protein GTO27_06060 [Candidatus Bathyarchaeota archaeon]|nr:hypothetical protein [Candidatus Bathyarchaeota archaeon]